MEYNFSSLCNDQLENLKKRLESLSKSFVVEYKKALSVINSHTANEHHNEIFVEIDDLLRDQVHKCEIFYTETLNKVQRVLGKHL